MFVCPVFVNVCALSVLGFDKVPWWGTLLISIGFSLVTALIVWFIVCPRLKNKIERKLRSFNSRVRVGLMSSGCFKASDQKGLALTPCVLFLIQKMVSLIMQSLTKMIKRCHRIYFSNPGLTGPSVLTETSSASGESVYDEV